MLLPGPFSKPIALVALAWGSRSISKTRLPFSAKQAERFTAVVVLPTPPFWLAIAKSFIEQLVWFQGGYKQRTILTGLRDRSIKSMKRAAAPPGLPEADDHPACLGLSGVSPARR